MGYGLWRPDPLPERKAIAYYDRYYRRSPLAAWDARWRELSVEARSFMLNVVKGPTQKPSVKVPPQAVVATQFPAHVLKELTEAGFVEIQPARSRAFPDRVIACQSEGLYDFATRVRALKRNHLLSKAQPSRFEIYVNSTFHGPGMAGAIANVLRAAGLEEVARLDDLLSRYVTHHRWPGWVARSLKNPVADQILDVIQKAGGSISLDELAGRIKGSDPAQARSALDALIVHLAVVEDLRPETLDLMVGFLPSVASELSLASQPRKRPPLIVVERPKELGPDGGPIIDDLRGFLLEVASEPPRLRQDHTLFHKELSRFEAILEPLPAWLMDAMHWLDLEGRPVASLTWARTLKLVKEAADGKHLQLRLTPKGQQWLSGGLDEQYDDVYRLLAAPSSRIDVWDPLVGWLYRGLEVYSGNGPGDMRFLGEPVQVRKVKKGQPIHHYRDPEPSEIQALRKSLDQALATLKPGVFHRLESVAAHLSFGEGNPLNVGLALDQTVVFWDHRTIPPLEELREQACVKLLESFVRKRLIPLGCVRAAFDAEGRLCVARSRRLDAYFGREVPPGEMAPASSAEAKVVVQPDFSVIVIGLNPAPAAELAPFCERTSRGAGQGAMILKITRDSVIKAVSQGLKASEIVARLERHATNGVPANVLREVQGWSKWVRQVKLTSMTVLRCPDRDTTDRVMGALKRQGERISDTLVAIEQKKLASADRAKLKAQGIVIQDDLESPKAKAKSKPKTRNWRGW